jgi:hypothetical protein
MINTTHNTIMVNLTHNRQFILRKINMTHQEYCELVERGGYAWLDKYLFCDPKGMKAASHSSMFWKWWVNEWNIRDDRFVRHVRFCNPDIEQRDYYFSVHAIYKLEIRPNKWAIADIEEVAKKQIMDELMSHLNSL